MALCAGIATVTLTLGAIGSLPAAARRLGTVEIPIAVRPIAAVLVIASMMAVPMRPRAAFATVAPPIVRLTDAAELADDDAGDVADDVASPGATHQIAAHSDRPLASYIVQPGDCLWSIAGEVLAARGIADPSSVEIARLWPAIYEANQSLIGDNPNLIYPGQSLQIPEV